MNHSDLSALATLALALVSPASRQTEIVPTSLSPEEAREMGIAMKSRPIGENRLKVWLEFERAGLLDSFTHAEMRMRDDQGADLLSARLEPYPLVPRRPEGLNSVSFSAPLDSLDRCEFRIFLSGGAVEYALPVAEFLGTVPISA